MERAVFYLIGQTLVAAPNSLIIFDEPELHIHRSILSRLWDELEAARHDCAFVIISHDLEFIAASNGQKFFLHSYSSTQGWEIEEVPLDTGFTEEMTALILGSRKPVLFVEGGVTSLDLAVYRACYTQWTVISRNSCEEVIHAVTTMRANAQLTRITCAGLVDADDRTADEVNFLRDLGVSILPVSEIENIFILPEVLEAIAIGEGHIEPDLSVVVNRILAELFEDAAKPARQNSIIMQYCRRRIDRTLKKVDLSDCREIGALKTSFNNQTQALDIDEIERLIKDNLADAIARQDAPKLLKWYDNKGILGIACKAKNTTKQLFEQWIVRAMRNDSAPSFSKTIRQLLHVIHAS